MNIGNASSTGFSIRPLDASSLSVFGNAQSYPFISTFTYSEVISMNKDQFAVLAEGTANISKVFDKMADAKAYAKQLTQTVKGRVLIVKAIYAVTPKVDVEEEDL